MYFMFLVYKDYSKRSHMWFMSSTRYRSLNLLACLRSTLNDSSHDTQFIITNEEKYPPKGTSQEIAVFFIWKKLWWGLPVCSPGYFGFIYEQLRHPRKGTRAYTELNPSSSKNSSMHPTSFGRAGNSSYQLYYDWNWILYRTSAMQWPLTNPSFKCYVTLTKPIDDIYQRIYMKFLNFMNNQKPINLYEGSSCTRILIFAR